MFKFFLNWQIEKFQSFIKTWNHNQYLKGLNFPKSKRKREMAEIVSFSVDDNTSEVLNQLKEHYGLQYRADAVRKAIALLYIVSKKDVKKDKTKEIILEEK